jgi:hypothetical protein
MGHEQVVRTAGDVPGGRDSRRCRLRVTPNTIDYRWLECGRTTELEAEVSRKPRGGHHVHLLTYVHRVGGYDQSDRSLPAGR